MINFKKERYANWQLFKIDIYKILITNYILFIF